MQPNPATDEFLQKVYPGLYGKSRHTVAKPGDRVAMKGVDVRVVASAGQSLTSALPGAGGANPYCSAYKAKDPDPSENAQSVGTHYTFGRFKAVHMGDLTWNKEHDLMCPSNRLGTVDLFVVSHHGQPVSNSEVLVHALQPRVAILNNGTRKGGQPDAMKVLFSSPRLEDLWQIHFSLLSGQEYTVPGLFIANGMDEQPAAMPIAAAAAPAPGTGRRAAARAQRAGLLDQGLREGRWFVYGDKRPERVQQDIRGEAASKPFERGFRQRGCYQESLGNSPDGGPCLSRPRTPYFTAPLTH